MQNSKLLHSAFESRVKTHPDSLALIYHDQTLTYLELNSRANQLANFLIAEGIGSGSIVGVCFNPCFEQIISVLAILKTGAAYLPLDPSYPINRLVYITEDSGLSIVLTDNKTPISVNSKTKIIPIETISNTLIQYSELPPKILDCSANLAYIIYTSGTTGNPKGVMIEHQNAYNTVSQMNDIFELLQTDKILLNTSLGFDPSVWMIFWPLSCGSSIVLCKSQIDPIYIIENIQKYHIRLLHAGPTLLRMLVNQGNLKECSSLELIIGGGEAWKLSDLKAIKTNLLRCELCNVYGPTEASIHATYWHSKGKDLNNLDVIPIGKPINQMHAYILDEDLNELPVNEIGDLYLSGTGVGRGYLNKQQLTDEKFIHAGSRYNNRLYRTGDRAKKLPDGNIIFIGRDDDQVKLRGFRIELQEVENQILKSGLVRNAAVIAISEDGITNELIAFYILPFELIRDVETKLKIHLKNAVPQYMIPNMFIPLDHFPTTTNHKVDKVRLREIYLEQSRTGKQSFREINLNDDTTEILKNLWAETLKTTHIEKDQHFFDAGGDSLKALELISRINSHFNTKYSVTKLFDHPTINKFSSLVSQIKAGQNNLDTQATLVERIKWPISDNQKWLLRVTKGSLSINNIVMPIEIEDYDIDPLVMNTAVKKLVQQQPLLRINIIVDDEDKYKMVINDMHDEIFEFRDLTDLSKEQQNQEFNNQNKLLNELSIDIAKDALFRVVLLKCSSKISYLYIYMHHLISDPKSGALVLKELLDLYSCINHNKEVEIHNEDMSFMEFICEESSKKHLPNYKECLDSWLNILSLSTCNINFGKSDDNSLVAGLKEVIIPQHLVRKLREFSKQKQITLFSLFLSVTKLVFYELYKQSTFGIGVNISKRNDIKWSKMIGPLSEQAISIVDFSKIKDFNDLINLTLNNLHNIMNASVSIESIYNSITKEAEKNTDLFNVLFDYEKNDINSGFALKINRLPLTPTNEIRRHLTIRIFDEEEMLFQIRYRKNLFDIRDIDNIVKKYFNAIDLHCD